MTTKDKIRILWDARWAFFKAMRAGYASNAQSSIKTKTSDGYRIITFTDGDFRVEDRYCVTPHSNSSAGTTTIFYKGDPVWWMSYGGFYPEDVIEFLKVALLYQYNRGIFFGGRGPTFITSGDGLAYENRPVLEDAEDHFWKFKGREEIYNQITGKLLGFHEYWGMSLI